jgi:iodotyrosine deiodinase
MAKSKFIPLKMYREYSTKTMNKRARDFYLEMKRRRSVRQFSNRPVPLEIIENCIRVAGTAPSGANMQPWHFVVVKDADLKTKIRIAAEEVENEFYHRRAHREQLQVFSDLGTDAHKPFLEEAPYLIVIFARRYYLGSDGEKVKHYYVGESVGIATGLLITAIHHAGLVALTYTPSPMNFLTKILNRPAEEKPFMIVAAGYPAKNAVVPDISKKSLVEIVTFK